MIQNVSFIEAIGVWAKIGLTSFGGPAGQIALMHQLLVDERRWISEKRFLQALNFCMLLPGPEAQQLATYIGWKLHGVRGGLVAGTLFIVPGVVVIMALSFVYAIYGNIALVQGLFLGLKAAVVVIVLQAVVRIGSRTLKTRGPILLAIGAFLAMAVWHVPFPYVVAGSGIAGVLIGRLGRENSSVSATDSDDDAVGSPGLVKIVAVFGALWLAPVIALVVLFGPDNVYSNIGMFFSKMAVVTFGGAYAVLAYVSQEAVTTFGWLAPGEMIDGLAMAETTPGPLIMVTQFVGFIAAWRNPGMLPPGVAAVIGALLTTWVTFVPCFLWIFAGAPYISRLQRNASLAAALAGVTAAVVGVIGHLAVWFSTHALFDDTRVLDVPGGQLELPLIASLSTPALALTLLAAGLTFGLRLSIPLVLAITGLAGVLLLS